MHNKKRIYFVQTVFVFNNEYFLPYAVGMLAANAFSDSVINDSFTIADLIYKSDGIESTADSIKDPDVVAFSCYMWNYRFNLKLAEVLKKRYPDCKIIFGGHQITDGKDWLKKYGFIDYTIYGEGEPTFKKLMLSFLGKVEISDINNVCYRNGDEIISNKTVSITEDVNSYPSPYLSGIFDEIIKKSGDKFAAILETNRGCPHHCSYCDWGDYAVKMRKFSYERVCAEIDWMGKNNIAFVDITDSNFGLFDCDEKYIDELIAAKNKYGYPTGINLTFTKNSTEKIFRMNKKLFENSMSRGATLSMQSLSPAALENIGRKNMPIENYIELLKLYNESSIPAYTELILGLPGETYESFCKGMEFLLENGQHNSIRVFFCELLPNSVMSQPEYIKKFGIKSIKRDFVTRSGPSVCAGIDGKSEIVVATATMNEEKMLDAALFSFIIQVFHNYGLLRFIAIYLHEVRGISYSDFYNGLMEWFTANPDTFSGRMYKQFKLIHKKALKGECSDTYHNEALGDIEFNLTDGAFLQYVRQYDTFLDEVSEYLASLFGEDKNISELKELQRTVINRPSDKQRFAVLTYNWIQYFDNIIAMKPCELIKTKPYTLTVTPKKEHGELESYIVSVIIKGRRLGASIALNDSESCKITNATPPDPQ